MWSAGLWVLSDSCTVTPSPAVDKSTQENDLLLGGSLVFSYQLQNHKGIFFVSVYTLSFDRLCPSWTILRLFFVYLIINPLSSGRKHPQTLWHWYRSLTFPEVSLEFSVQTGVHSCQNSFWGSYLNWFGDGHIEHPLNDSSGPQLSRDCTFPVCYNSGIKENHGLGA